MSSFYDDMYTYYEKENSPDDVLWYPYIKTYLKYFKSYGSFLDSIPNENRTYEIEQLFEILNNYARLHVSYNQSDIPPKEVGKKIGIAKKFRKLLGEYPNITEQFEHVRKKHMNAPLIELIGFTDMYIKDLSSNSPYSSFHNNRPHPKPNKEDIKNHLTALSKKYHLKNYSDNIINLVKAINPAQ